MSRVAVVGGGWAGMAAAVQACRAGHAVTVFEAARSLGGRARALTEAMAGLDNGQHILIGAYTETLGLMALVGVDLDAALQRRTLSLRYPDGGGLVLPRWPAPLDALAGILTARGWDWRDKLSLLRAALSWKRAHFECAPSLTVARMSQTLRARVVAEFVEPLCLSALNTPMAQASAQVFLRVLRDGLLGPAGSSHLLLPQYDLSRLFPDAAARWLLAHGGEVRRAHRVQELAPHAGGWTLDGEPFDTVLLACAPWDAARLVEECDGAGAQFADGSWAASARALRHEAIATVYALSRHRLAQPMLALRSGPGAPAQFVFDRGLPRRALPPGLEHSPGNDDAQRVVLAFVVSACREERDALSQQVMAQGRAQLGLDDLELLQTVVERRATFACTPGLQRPAAYIAPGLLACGDYVEGPYPATLEGAVRSATAAAALMTPRAA
ncbi:MAG: hydroxysqualene dehydroxylase HpnE [Burkholderiaceae bacterium]|nr:hydroxysqualene dehydroxylase HpnE [Burkholderiaceae bacterium]MDO9089216.1 hydroxysqualene dehydroxylase HpnE [Burkholderiaceae bacterium]